MDLKNEKYRRIGELKRVPLLCLTTPELQEYLRLCLDLEMPEGLCSRLRQEMDFRERWETHRLDGQVSPDKADEIGRGFWAREKNWPDVQIPGMFGNRGAIVPVYLSAHKTGPDLQLPGVSECARMAIARVENERMQPYEPKILSGDRETSEIDGTSAQFLVYASLLLDGLYRQAVPPWGTASASCDVKSERLGPVRGISQKVMAACAKGITVFWVHPDNEPEAKEASQGKIWVEALPTDLKKAEAKFFDWVMGAHGQDASDQGCFRWLLQKKNDHDGLEFFWKKQESVVCAEKWPLSYWTILAALAHHYSRGGVTEKAHEYLEKALAHRNEHPGLFVPSYGLEYWLEAHVNWPLMRAIDSIDLLEYVDGEEKAFRICHETRKKIEKLLSLETEGSLLHFYRFIALNTLARVSNYRCRAFEAEPIEWEKGIRLLFAYKVSRWTEWEDRKMPRTSVRRHLNTLLEFYLAYRKYCRLHGHPLNRAIESKVARLAYSWEEMGLLQDPYDFTYGSLWHASRGRKIIDILKTRNEMDGRFEFPLCNLQVALAEELWKQGNPKDAVEKWEKVADAFRGLGPSILVLMACRALLTWGKCLREENLDAQEPLSRLAQMKGSVWPNVGKHWDFFFGEVSPDAPAIAFARAEAKLPY